MKIRTLHMVEGARMARGMAVIIDVFRAFSTACYAINAGARRIIPVASTKEAFALKEKYPDFLLMGEENEQKVRGFDFGNSPSEIRLAQLEGKTLIQRTSAGTQGIVNASQADEIITGSFVNAEAIIKYILRKLPREVSLVAMGYRARQKSEEDSYCALYIRNGLEKKDSPFELWKKEIALTSGQRFFARENQAFAPEEDFDLCLALNEFNFVLRIEPFENGFVQLKKFIP